MEQNIICQDIFSGMLGLLRSFTQARSQTGSTFSHGSGFQPSPTQQQQPASTVPAPTDPIEQLTQIFQWLVMGAFVAILIYGQVSGRQNREPADEKQNIRMRHHNGQGGPGGVH